MILRLALHIDGRQIIVLPHATRRYTERVSRHDDLASATAELQLLLAAHGTVSSDPPAWIYAHRTRQSVYWLLLGEDIAFPLDVADSGTLAAMTCMCRSGLVHHAPRRQRASRWHGNRYWLSTAPAAIPERVKRNRERMHLSPGEIAKAATSDKDRIWLDGQLTTPRTCAGRPDYIRLFQPVDYLWENARLPVAANANYSEWIERCHDREGAWALTLPDGKFEYLIRGRLVAVLMPIRLKWEEMNALYGSMAEMGAL